MEGYKVILWILLGIAAIAALYLRAGYLSSEGYEDRDNIYRMIRLADRSGPTTLRLTGDVLVSNLNKVTQKLTKRKVI